MSDDPQLTAAAAPAPGDAPRGAGRIRTIDWLRGLSVIVMVTLHSLIFLTHAHDQDPARGWFAMIGGLPAPTFTFAAGFSLALVTARATDDRAKRRARALKSLLRIGQVLLASMLLRHIMWDNFSPANWSKFQWVDVLTSIALMLIVAWGVLFILPTWRALRYAAFGLLAVLAFTIGPWVDVPHRFGIFTGLFNNGLYPDTWPMVPWAGYGWLGAILGLIVGGSSAGAQRRSLTLAFVGIFIFGWLGHRFGHLPYGWIDPTVNPSLFTNSADRLWRIALVALVLCGLEARGFTFVRGPIKPLGVLVTLFSHHALVAYIGHLILIYGYLRFRPLNRFHLAVDWPAYAGLAFVVLMGTAGLCTAFEALRRWRQGIKPVRRS